MYKYMHTVSGAVNGYEVTLEKRHKSISGSQLVRDEEGGFNISNLEPCTSYNIQFLANPTNQVISDFILETGRHTMSLIFIL